MSKDKILMPDGSVINRTYFLQDLKVGDELIGYNHYRKDVGTYTVKSISRKYAKMSLDYNMLLENGIYVNKNYSQFNIIFFKTKEELDAYLSNLQDKEDLRFMLSNVSVFNLDVEKVVKLKSLLKEFL